MELRLEERGALDSSCWRWVGREACRDRVPPTGRDRGGQEEEEGEREEVMKLMVRDGGQSLYGMDGEMVAARRRMGWKRGMVWKQYGVFCAL